VLTRALICPFLNLYPTYHPRRSLGGPCLVWGPVSASARVRVLAATAPGIMPRHATGCGEAIVTAFEPRTREYTVKALALYRGFSVQRALCPKKNMKNQNYGLR